MYDLRRRIESLEWMKSACVVGFPHILRASFKAPGVLWTSSAIAFPWRAFLPLKEKARSNRVQWCEHKGRATRLEGKVKVRLRLDAFHFCLVR
jgi:hypothetical protein